MNAREDKKIKTIKVLNLWKYLFGVYVMINIFFLVKINYKIKLIFLLVILKQKIQICADSTC